MIKAIFKIRAIQLFRLIKEIGVLRSLVVAVLVSFFSFIIIQTIGQTKNAILVSTITGFVILSIHASRKDKHFTRINFSNSYTLFLTEYLILTLPVLSTLAYFKEWKAIVLLFFLCIIIPRIYLNIGLKSFPSSLRFLLNPFSSKLTFNLNIKIPIKNPKAFEWICGIRRFFIPLTLIYVFILAFSFKAYVAPAGFIFLAIITSGFYFQGESREFMELFDHKASTFIPNKIGLSLKYLFIMLMPIGVIALIFQPHTWIFTLGAMVISALIHIITIIFKYALFVENKDLSQNGTIVFINVICILLPFLWPLPVFMGIRYYIKAHNKLKFYFNDIDR